MSASMDDAARRLRGARRVFVMTGAGVSAESGIPTFRGQDGLWRNVDVQQLASVQGFQHDPALVWEWYAWRIGLVQNARPNPAHEALVELEKRTENFLLLTQNVDGLHQAAGSMKVSEIHGNIRRVRDVITGKVYPEGEIVIRPPFPVWTPAGNLARPDVVWFGEMIKLDAVEAVEDFLSGEAPDVCLVIGTSGMFPYIQRWATWAQRLGAQLIEINLEPSPLTESSDVYLEGKAGEVLPRLLG